MTKENYLDVVGNVSKRLLEIRALERELEGEGDTIGISALGGEVRELRDTYNDELMGTPEELYLNSLISHFEGSVPQAVYDIEVSQLGLSVRALNCLENDQISYVGQLVQRSESEMLRTPNFGKASLSEVKNVLNGYGLKFGMSLDYNPPKESE